MEVIAGYLADKSAWEWAGAARDRWHDLLSTGEIATCSMVELEVLYSSRSSADWVKDFAKRSHLERLKIDQDVFDRSIEVQGLLSKHIELGHRSVDLPDLIVAACAEQSGVAVLHYDADFDRIAEITGQPTEWLAEKGSLKR